MSKIFTFNKLHPFFEFVEETDNHNQMVRVGLREYLVNGMSTISSMVGGNHIGIGLMPDPEYLTNTALTESFKNRYMDHLVGTLLNEYLKRVLCRQHLGAFAGLQLFNRETCKPNPKALEILFQMIASGLPFLKVASKESDTGIAFRFGSKGNWYTSERYQLPELEAAGIELDYAKVQREFEGLRSDSEGDFSAANEAFKAKILCSVSSMLYNMRFSEEVKPELLEDPNKKLILVERPVDLAGRLKYDLEKAQKDGRMKSNVS